MIRVDNVKLVLVDKENNYLVGERFGTSHKYSLFGGHVEKGEKHWFTTASRELNEETNEVFQIEYRNHKYELVIADLYTMPIAKPKPDNYFLDRNQLYVVLKVDGYFRDYIDDLRIRFGKNQDEYLFYILFLLHDTFPDISVSSWIKIYEEYKTSKGGLNKLFQDLKFENNDIRFIYKYFDKLTARLEMDNINIAKLSELKSSRGLYQRDILSVL